MYVGGKPLSLADPLGLCPCAGGTWDQDRGDGQFSISFGAYTSKGKVNFTCRSDPSLKCKATQWCIGGGLTFGAGYSWTLTGTAFNAPDSNNLGGWSGGQGGGGAGAFSGQGGYDGSGGNFGAGIGFGGGPVFYMRCNTYNLECSCPSCQSKK